MEYKRTVLMLAAATMLITSSAFGQVKVEGHTPKRR